MAEPEKKGESKKHDGPTCDRALLCPDEWEEPKGRKVLGEYHKEGLPEGMFGVDADLERFEEYWSKKGSVNVQGEYHKEGAPYVEKVIGREDAVPNVPKAETKPRPEAVEPKKASKAVPEAVEEMPEPSSNRPIDLATVEVISYALFRAAFGTGLRIPIKFDQMVDAEVTVKGKDIVINTNEFYTNIPDLAIWRVVYTHKGTTVFEFGRGVKKGFKVHRWNALKLGFLLWKQARRQAKAKERMKKERDRANLESIAAKKDVEES